MKCLFIVLAAVGSTDLCAADAFPDFSYKPPADWSQPTFVLSQDYPKRKPRKPSFPWEQIDFTQKPEQYLQAVIEYCLRGNVTANFQPAKNNVRRWYHAPWLHYGPRGREFVNGLTGERSSRPRELSPTQTEFYRNFAVGFYNDLGGFTIGSVWAVPTKPNYDNVSFPEGTVSFKLLFTTAPESIASFLVGSPTWVADIDRSDTAAAVLANKVRLLQVDIAVKDKRSRCGGWVFGTFHYDAAVPGSTPWHKLRPLTLTWGNDVTLTPTLHAGGARPKESWINPASPIAQYRSSPPAGVSPPRFFGWGGRGNGPVDNPASSCLSCHSTAQIDPVSGMIAPARSTEAQTLRWFRNLSPGESFDAGQKTLDFSLQLGVGIQNFQTSHRLTAPPSPAPPDASQAVAQQKRVHLFTRDPEEDPAR